MSASPCAAPIGLATLAEYWLDELDEPRDARIDEHLLGCAQCSALLAELVALADGIRVTFRQGLIRAFVTDAFVRRLSEEGLRVSEYRIPCNGSVNCTITPEDDVAIARLEAPLSGVTRLNAIAYYANDAPGEVFRDIPFSAASGEVVLTPKIAQLRTMPSHRHRVRLVAVEANGERVIGDYTFNHTAYQSGRT